MQTGEQPNKRERWEGFETRVLVDDCKVNGREKGVTLEGLKWGSHIAVTGGQ